jgi:glycosyltransferase involved in cell wall biosynthesis
MESLNILMVTTSFPRYHGDSAGIFIQDLAIGLREAGHQVCVLAPHAAGIGTHDQIDSVEVRRFKYACPSQLQQLTYGDGVIVNVRRRPWLHFLWGPLLLSQIFGLFRLLKQQHFDIIHAHWWFPSGLAAAIVAQVLRKPLVLTSHGSDVVLLSSLKWLKPIAKWTYSRASFVTVLSTPLATALNEFLGNFDELAIIPEPLNLMRVDNTLSSNTSCSERYILYVGRLTEYKGVKFLVEAFAKLTSFLDVKLVIAGDGPLRGALQEQVRTLGLCDRVDFRGYLPNPDVLRLMKPASVLVMPSITGKHGEFEGLGVVLLEAMALGVPVIGSSSGGITDIIIDQQSGLLVPGADPESLAMAMKCILSDRDLAARLSDAGKARVRERFSVGSVVSRMLKVYASARGRL